jgi:hypothetical protein
MNPMRIAVVALLALGAAGAAAQETLPLQYRFLKGSIYRFAETTEIASVQEMMGQEVKSTMTVRSVRRSAIDDVLENGTIVIVTSADSLVFSMKSPRMDTTMVMSDMIGKRRKVKMLPTGEIQSRETLDSVRVEGQLRGQAGRETAIAHRLPGKPVKTGDSWKASIADTNEAMGGRMATQMDLTYTVAGVEKRLGHDCLKITYTGTTALAGKQSRNGMEFYLEGVGKSTGTLYFDPVLGLPVLDETSTEQEMTLALTGQQNMTIPMTNTMKSTRTLLP